MVKSELSGKKWWVLGLLSDVGWMMFFISLAVYLLNGADGLGTVAISAFFLLTALSALFVLAGIIALVSQRVRRLSRTLSKRQLTVSFGFTVFGALAGAVFSLASVVSDAVFHCETGVCFAAQCLMAAGCILCFAFGLPIFKSFHRVEGT